jgi:multidrug efflux pump
MTTAAMILGAIPLAIASGAGAESRQQIGWVIVGGMSLGTVLTLFVVPCVYAVMGWRPRRAATPAKGGVQLETSAAGSRPSPG